MDQFGQYQQVNNLGLGNNIDPNADYNNRYDDVNINPEE
jgi:outer membrane protein assembly factor BamA